METFLPAPSSSRPAYTPQAINATRLVALFPPDHRTPLSDFKPVILAQEEALFFRETAKAQRNAIAKMNKETGISDVILNQVYKEYLIKNKLLNKFNWEL